MDCAGGRFMPKKMTAPHTKMIMAMPSGMTVQPISSASDPSICSALRCVERRKRTANTMMVIPISDEKKMSTARMNTKSKSTWLAMVEACCGMNGRLVRKLGRVRLPSFVTPQHHEHEAAEHEHGGDGSHADHVHRDQAVLPARGIVVVAVERERVHDSADALLRGLDHREPQ